MDIPKNPIIILSPYLNSQIEVNLVNNIILVGKLVSFDKYSNMILEPAKEMNDAGSNELFLSTVFIKGSAVS